MDARLQFEWSGEKARKVVADLYNDKHLADDMHDIVNRDDAEYEINLVVRLKHRRKSRAGKKKELKVVL